MPTEHEQEQQLIDDLREQAEQEAIEMLQQMIEG